MTFIPYASEGQQTTRPTAATRAAEGAKRTRGEDPAPAPSHSKQHVPHDYRQVLGWGADLDHANRPSYPRELPSDVMTARGDVKHWQTPRSKVHQSNEHPNRTPVFGESCPPHGLSGLVRDYAYQYGEATSRHWMLLMLADRIDMVEHMIGDPHEPPRRKGVTLGVAATLGAVVVGIALTAALRRR